jgi:hypothetical protein
VHVWRAVHANIAVLVRTSEASVRYWISLITMNLAVRGSPHDQRTEGSGETLCMILPNPTPVSFKGKNL